MTYKKIVLFGGSGLLGTRILELLSPTYTFIAPTHEKVDLLIPEQITRYLASVSCDLIIYAAGETNVDRAERNQSRSLRLNYGVIEDIGRALPNVPIVYFSTDAVFRGDRENMPYTEKDTVDPCNYYGYTKAKGEEKVLSLSNKNLILRCITLYASNYPKKSDFVRKTVSKLSKNEGVVGIIDQYANPTFVDDAIAVLDAAIAKKLQGIFHVGSTDCISNYSFIKKIATIFGADGRLIKPISFADFFANTSAKRAQFSWLDTTKIRAVIGNNIIHTNEENMQIFYNQYRSLHD